MSFIQKKKMDQIFPTQVEYKNSRYLLTNTYMVNSKSQEDNIKKRAQELNILVDVKID